MNFKKTGRFFLAALSCTLITVSGEAKTLDAPPNKCPTAEAVRSIGVSQNAVEMSNGLWLTGRRNQLYNTTSRWTLLMGNISANTRTQAYAKATDALSSLAFDIGPVQGPLGKWVCYYHNTYGYTTMTLNPPIAQAQDLTFINAVKK